MFTLGQGLEVRRPVEVEVGVPGGAVLGFGGACGRRRVGDLVW